jgi:hypothetical protein
MYRVGQDNIMRRCLTTSKAHIVLKELHEGVAKKKTFCYKYYYKENFGCRLLVANYIKKYS